jgi:hypothetical protein
MEDETLLGSELERLDDSQRDCRIRLGFGQVCEYVGYITLFCHRVAGTKKTKKEALVECGARVQWPWESILIWT